MGKVAIFFRLQNLNIDLQSVKCNTEGQKANRETVIYKPASNIKVLNYVVRYRFRPSMNLLCEYQ